MLDVSEHVAALDDYPSGELPPLPPLPADTVDEEEHVSLPLPSPPSSSTLHALSSSPRLRKVSGVESVTSSARSSGSAYVPAASTLSSSRLATNVRSREYDDDPDDDSDGGGDWDESSSVYSIDSADNDRRRRDERCVYVLDAESMRAVGNLQLSEFGPLASLARLRVLKRTFVWA